MKRIKYHGILVFKGQTEEELFEKENQSKFIQRWKETRKRVSWFSEEDWLNAIISMEILLTSSKKKCEKFLRFPAIMLTEVPVSSIK